MTTVKCDTHWREWASHPKCSGWYWWGKRKEPRRLPTGGQVELTLGRRHSLYLTREKDKGSWALHGKSGMKRNGILTERELYRKARSNRREQREAPSERQVQVGAAPPPVLFHPHFSTVSATPPEWIVRATTHRHQSISATPCRTVTMLLAFLN